MTIGDRFMSKIGSQNDRFLILCTGKYAHSDREDAPLKYTGLSGSQKHYVSSNCKNAPINHG